MTSTNQTIDQELKAIEAALDEYEAKTAGMPALKQMIAPQYIDIDINDLKKKSPEDLAEAVLAIRQYSLYLQRVINREKSWINWCEKKIQEVAAIEIPKVDKGFSWEERKILWGNTTPLCKRINSVLREATLKLDRLSYLPNELHKLADSINDMKFMAIRRIQTQEQM